MTKKKREFIDILLDSVKPEDWPEDAKYAAQDKYSAAHGKNKVMFYVYAEPKIIDREPHTYFNGQVLGDPIQLPDLCENWNKTIVHRDEFMKRWNELNPVDDLDGWIQWNGGEMPVEKGTLIDVKYRDRPENIGVMAGFAFCEIGSNPLMSAVEWKHYDLPGDIIAYRLHVPQEQKTTQQLALEKFGTDWHDNEGVQPVNDKVLIDLIMCNGDEKKKYLANHWSWHKEQALKIKKWRIHSDEKESQIDKAAKSLSEGVEKLNGVLLTAQQAFDGFKKAAEAIGGADIESIISERGNNYGRFEDGAEIMQQLKLIAHTSQGWERMKPVQRESMDMILHKVGRILNGNPNYIENYTDIAGYAKLVIDILSFTDGATDAEVIYKTRVGGEWVNVNTRS